MKIKVDVEIHSDKSKPQVGEGDGTVQRNNTKKKVELAYNRRIIEIWPEGEKGKARHYRLSRRDPLAAMTASLIQFLSDSQRGEG